MFQKLSRRRTLAALAAVSVLAITAVAIAYWSTTGSGSGSGTVATANGTVSLSASFANGIYPGGYKSVSFAASNPGDTDLRVGTVHLDSVSVDSGHAGCNVSDFTMPDVVQNQTIAHGASNVALANGGTLSFANDPVNSQDACKGATITLNLTSN